MIAKPFFLGIDIQLNHISIVGTRQQKLDKFINYALEAPILGDGKIVNWEMLKQFLLTFISQEKLKKPMATVSLPIAQVHQKSLRLPAGLEQHTILLEVQKHIQHEMSWIKEPLAMDFYLDKSNEAFWEAQIYVSRRSYIEQLSRVFTEAGVNLRRIDIDAYAINRACHYLLGHHLEARFYLILYVNQNVVWLLNKKYDTLSLVKHWEFYDTEALLDSTDKNLEQVLQLIPQPKPTALILMGDRQLTQSLLTQGLRQTSLKLHRLVLPIEDIYWLAFGLAL